MKLNRERKPGKDRKQKKGLSLIIMLIVLIFAVVAALTGFIADWLWFGDVGYRAVFWKEIVTELKIGIPVFIAAGLLVRVYLKSLCKGYFSEIESHEIPNLHKLNVISWVLSVIFGLAVAVFTSGDIWMNFLKFVDATKFDLKDPLFGIDISFYVFKLEFLTQINNIVLAVIIGVILITLIFYGILLTVRTPDFFEREDDDTSTGGTGEDNSIPFGTENGPNGADVFKNLGKFARGGVKSGSRRKFDVNDSNFEHLMKIASGKLTILGVVFYIMLGADFFLKQFDLLHAHTGTVYGAGFTDVNVTLWVYRVIIALAAVGAVTLCIHMKKAEFKKLIRIPVIMVIVGIAGTGVALAVQSLVVSPDEINKESKYLKSNIAYTQHAYSLDNITVKAFSAKESLTGTSIANNMQTVGNIRINDYEPVKDYYNQTQSIRQYYDFNDVDVDRYNINGNETQTYLSAREINENKISETWLNRHIKYTHGYGVTISQVDAVTSSGQPDVLVKNIPPRSSVASLKITRPEIYFGELTNDYVIVNTDEKEFDYPDGNNNKYTEYKGNAGIKLNFFNRLIFAIREGSLKLLVSSNVHSDSRIIINRNIEKRVKKIMPYLQYDDDPYMTTVNGKLYWMVDAYTTSSYYPYSEPYSGKVNSTNYIRNSIKVVVDAYNGDVNYYIVDKDDPIAQTYKKIYPSLFKDFDKMPKGLQEHVRYPNTLFQIQSDVYTKYHMNEVKVFYQNEDLWDIANQIYGTKQKKMEPSYYTFKLPGETDAEFINMIPFTPKSKQNMTAVMMARNDGDYYGDLVVYKFPKNKTVYGPMQIEAQIDQNTEISKEFSLWDSSGSTYRRGDLFVIPIDDSLLYVEPVYLEASNQAIPEVKRVIVAYGDQIAYEPTLEGALESLFGGSYGASGADSSATTTSSSSGKKTQAELIKLANDEYDAATKARESGDWSGFGTHLNKLKSYLSQLQ